MEPALQEFNGKTFSRTSANRDGGARVDIHVPVDGFCGPGRVREHSSTFGFLNCLLPLTDQLLFPPVIGHMGKDRRDSIT